MKRRSFFSLLCGAVSAPAIVPCLCATEAPATPSSVLPELKKDRLYVFLEEESRRFTEEMRGKLTREGNRIGKTLDIWRSTHVQGWEPTAPEGYVLESRHGTGPYVSSVYRKSSV